MQVVNHEGMGVVDTMFSQMRVIGWQVGVEVGNVRCVLGRPVAQHGDKAKCPDPGQRQSGDAQPGSCPDPARQRIGHQPACMAERELCGKDSTAVLCSGRAIDDESDRRLGEGKAEADQRPKGKEHDETPDERDKRYFC